MPFTDSRMEKHVASLQGKSFAFGRGEAKPKEPSAEDLDAVAAEQKAKEATKPKAKIVAKG